MKIAVSIIFILQFGIQILITNGIMNMHNTTIMHEDLITSIVGCTMIIVFTIYDVFEKKECDGK